MFKNIIKHTPAVCMVAVMVLTGFDIYDWLYVMPGPPIDLALDCFLFGFALAGVSYLLMLNTMLRTQNEQLAAVLKHNQWLLSYINVLDGKDKK